MKIRATLSGGTGMKKALMIIGIVLIAVGVLSLLFALLNRFGYYNMLDGSAEQYSSLRRRMFIFLAAGIVLEILGVLCIIVHRRM